MEEEERRVHRCRYSMFAFVDEGGDPIEPAPKCTREGGMGNPRRIEASDCEACEHYKSRYIEYPLVVDEIEAGGLFDEPFYSQLSGRLVRVRPCDGKYGGRTLLGLMLGDLPWHMTVSYDETSRKLTCGAIHNPAILVLESREVVWGCESWWSEIDDPEGLEEIDDETIMEQPYVRWLSSLLAKREG